MARREELQALDGPRHGQGRRLVVRATGRRDQVQVGERARGRERHAVEVEASGAHESDHRGRARVGAVRPELPDRRARRARRLQKEEMVRVLDHAGVEGLTVGEAGRLVDQAEVVRGGAVADHAEDAIEDLGRQGCEGRGAAGRRAAGQRARPTGRDHGDEVEEKNCTTRSGREVGSPRSLGFGDTEGAVFPAPVSVLLSFGTHPVPNESKENAPSPCHIAGPLRTAPSHGTSCS